MVEKGHVCIGAVVLTYLHVHKFGFPSCLSENRVLYWCVVQCAVCIWREIELGPVPIREVFSFQRVDV